MKKTLVSALTTALVVGAASTTFAAANPFSDVPADHWAHDAITQLANDGVIEGYGDGTYRGDRSITRYEMAQMVARAMAKSDVSAADKADRVRAKLAAMRPRIAVARAKDRKAFNRQVNAYLKELRAQAAQDVNPYAAIRAKATHAPDDRDLGRRIMESRNANLKK